MEILFGLIAISVGLVAGVAIIFMWAIKSGQFDDLDSPAVAILSDADEKDFVPGEQGRNQD
jgi:cbb3-type cytochrome oxidase maturation protein